MLVTTSVLVNKNYDIIDIITGSTVYTTNVIKDTLSGFKNLGQRELESCTYTLQEARKVAIARLKIEAENLGADAVISVRFDSLLISNATFEISVYGTAIKYK